MSLKKFLFSRVFLKQLIIAILLATVLIIITMQGLKIYTDHGKYYAVPDFSGQLTNEATETASSYFVRVEVVDSVYMNNTPPGVVVDQIPEANFKVKENRVVFLTINANSPEQVAIPKLTDISFRQAQVLIENGGLQLGNISYSPSEYNDLVLTVMIDSVNVFPGERVAKNTPVDLVIGRTRGNSSTSLPDLLGLKITDAHNLLKDAMLNPGVLIYDESIVTKEDSINAKVWRQRPSPKMSSTISLGSSVDIWATIDSLKISDSAGLNF